MYTRRIVAAAMVLACLGLTALAAARGNSPASPTALDAHRAFVLAALAAAVQG